MKKEKKANFTIKKMIERRHQSESRLLKCQQRIKELTKLETENLSNGDFVFLIYKKGKGWFKTENIYTGDSPVFNLESS